LWGGAAPVAGADRGVGDVDAAEGAEHEEDGDVCCGSVDGLGGVGYLDICLQRSQRLIDRRRG